MKRPLLVGGLFAALSTAACMGAGMYGPSLATSAGGMIALALRADGGPGYEAPPPEDPEAAGSPLRCFEVKDPDECADAGW